MHTYISFLVREDREGNISFSTEADREKKKGINTINLELLQVWGKVKIYPL